LYQTIMTLEKNTEISNNTSTIIVEGGSLIVNDAKIGITSNSASTPIFLKSGQLRLENKDSILSVKEDTGRQVRYSMGNSSIIVGKTAKMPTVVANDSEISGTWTVEPENTKLEDSLLLSVISEIVIHLEILRQQLTLSDGEVIFHRTGIYIRQRAGTGLY
jgi:hypothetical protein